MNQIIKDRIEIINSGIVPEGYKKTPFGIFPCDWESVSIGSVSLNKGEYGLNAPACDFDDKLPKYIRITDIDENGNYVDTGACVDYKDGTGEYILKKGDIVFARTGATVGRSYLYKEKDGKLLYAGFLIKYSIDNKKINPYILFANCNTEKYWNWIKKISARSGQPGVNAEEYRQYKFIAPQRMEEQSKIAEILMKWDEAIELYEKLIEKLKQYKSICLQKMFPAKGKNVPEWRFKGFTGDWEQRKFSDLADTRRGLTYNPSNIREAGIRVLRSSNIAEDQFIYSEEDVFVEPSATNIPYANSGDILITSANGSTRLVGKHAIIKGIPNNSAVHGGFMLLATAKNPQFVNSLMSASWYSRFISLYVAGGNGAIGNLNKNDLDDQNVLVPKDAEQKTIGQFFSGLDNLITIYQCKVDAIVKQRKVLQQYLLTGIVRVKV